MNILSIRQPDFEARTPLVPELVPLFRDKGFAVHIEKGAGALAGFADKEYEAAGARVGSADSQIGSADVILTIRPPDKALMKRAKKGAILVGLLEPFGDKAPKELYAKQGIISFAMELLPRISRAQSMDILSSQSNLAGYKAVIEASNMFSRAFPMMMTAAGTIAPAHVFIMGVGVAGLQAIATAKRLGAIVSATDIRPIAKEQVESLGGKFVMVEDEETKAAQTSGGYAKELSADYQAKQKALIEEVIQKQDIVICTALIPGRKAPLLVNQSMVQSMKSGSIIIDLAAEQGGNCAYTRKDEVVEKNGVKIVGWSDLAGRLAQDSSTLYARNLLHFLSLIIDSEKKKIHIDWEDEIIRATTLTKDGALYERG